VCSPCIATGGILGDSAHRDLQKPFADVSLRSGHSRHFRSQLRCSRIEPVFIIGLNSSAKLAVLPVAGGNLSHMIVPSMVLGLGTMAFLTRLMRSSMLEIINSDFIRTAKAKGLPPARIFLRHELRNAILPVITVLGPAIAAITTGGFVVELVFAIPGLGRYFVGAVQQLDYTVIMGTTVFYGAFLVFMVIVVDLVYGFIDARVTLE
jgi:ABC-type dipeptide/oligopeptide/nickel transport system permease component